jgi:nitrogen regulatory protein PII
MAYLVVVIVDDLDQCNPILDAWETAGVTGVTILESYGIGRIRQKSIRDDFPLMPTLRNLLRSEEHHHRTLFSVVETEKQVQVLAEAAQSVVGDFDQPDTGFMFVVPLHQVFGLNKPPLRPESNQ